jgi:hypothetical protein
MAHAQDKNGYWFGQDLLFEAEDYLAQASKKKDI